jgi:ribosomal protein S18 acetylase RimI-like enzyme
MKVRELTTDDRAWVERLVSERFASFRIVSRGVVHDARALPGLISESDGAPVGLLQYRVVGEQFEVVILIAVPPRQGVGRFLLGEAEPIARSHGCKRLWLITTNDNTAAISFYRAIGWQQTAIHRGAMHESRRLKPEIPEFASDGTPIEDEIEFELLLEGT